MEISFTGKRIIITGGSRGIGKAMVEAFASRGANVSFTYHKSEAPALELVRSLTARDCQVAAYRVDGCDRTQVEKFLNDVIHKQAGIDVLINNAGVTHDGLILSMEPEHWQHAIDANLTSMFFFTKTVAKQMMRQRSGSILNLSSIAASHPNRGQCNYAASKGGVESFTKAVAVELGAKNIRVNAIAPGMIETDMSKEVIAHAKDMILSRIPLGRLGGVQDIANAAMFLVSDFAGYISGQIVHVDGGFA